jgi:hypothetical protein
MADVRAGLGHAGGCAQAGDGGDPGRGGVRGSEGGLQGREHELRDGNGELQS